MKKHLILTSVALIGLLGTLLSAPTNTTLITGAGEIPDFYMANSYRNAGTITPTNIAGSSLIDGQANSAAQSNAAAIDTCANKGVGWFLPSTMELALATSQLINTGTTWMSGITPNPSTNYFLTSTMSPQTVGQKPVAGIVGYSRPQYPYYRANLGVATAYYVWCAWRESDPVIRGVTHGNRTGAGTVEVSANSPGAAIRWYASVAGGNSLGTTASGEAWTTPDIDTTTIYYVEAYDEATGRVSTPRTAVEAAVVSGTLTCPDGYTYCEGCGWSDAKNAKTDVCYKIISGRPYTNYGGSVTNSKDGSVAQNSILAGGGSFDVALQGEPNGTYLASQYEYGLWYGERGYSCATTFGNVMQMGAGTVLTSSIAGYNDKQVGTNISLAAYPYSYTPNTYSGSWQYMGCNNQAVLANSGSSGYSYTLSSGSVSSGNIFAAKGLYYWRGEGGATASVTVTPEHVSYYACGADSVTLRATASEGAVVEWYSSLSGGTPLHVGEEFTGAQVPAAAKATINYYVQARSTVTGLTSGRKVVEVSNVGMSVDTLKYGCGTVDATFSASVQTPGLVIEWWDAPTGGSMVYSSGPRPDQYGWTSLYNISDLSETTTLYATAGSSTDNSRCADRVKAVYNIYTPNGGHPTYCPTGTQSGMIYCPDCGYNGSGWEDAWTTQTTVAGTMYNNTDIPVTVGYISSQLNGRRNTANAVAASRAGTLATHCTNKGTGWYVPAVAELDRYATFNKDEYMTAWTATSTHGTVGIGGYYHYSFYNTSNQNAYIYSGGGHPAAATSWTYPRTTSYSNSNVSSYNYTFIVGNTAGNNTGSRCWWHPGTTSATVTITSTSQENYNCNTKAVTLTVNTSPVSGVTVEWFTQASGGTRVATGASYTPTGIADAGTTYYAQAVLGAETTERVAFVIPIGAFTPTISHIEPTTYACGTYNPTFSATTEQAGVTIDWWTASTGGARQSAGSGTMRTYGYTNNYSPGAQSANLTYYAEARHIATGCVSARQAQTYTRYTANGGNATYCPTGVPDGFIYCPGCGYNGSTGAWVAAWTKQTTAAGTVFNATDVLTEETSVGRSYVQPSLYDGRLTTERAVAVSKAGTMMTACVNLGAGTYLPSITEIDRWAQQHPNRYATSWNATSTFGTSGIGGWYKQSYENTSNKYLYLYTGNMSGVTTPTWVYSPVSYGNSNVSSYNYSFRAGNNGGDNHGSRCWWRPATTALTITEGTHTYSCSANTAVIKATASAGVVEVYTAATGGTPTYTSSGTSLSWTTPSLSQTAATTYYVQAKNGSAYSARIPIVVKGVMPVLSAIQPTAYGCGTVLATFSASTSTPGSTVDWYTAASGGSVVSTGAASSKTYGHTTNYTVSLSSSTTYYAQARNSISGCTSARQAQTYTIYSANGGNTTYCPTGTQSGMEYCEGCGYDGSTGKWVNAWTQPTTTSGSVFNNADVYSLMGMDYMTLSDGKRVTNRATTLSRAGTLMAHCTGKGTGWYVPALLELDRYAQQFRERYISPYTATVTYGGMGVGGYYRYSLAESSTQTAYVYTGGGYNTIAPAWSYTRGANYYNSNVSSYTYGFSTGGNNTGSRCWWRPAGTDAAQVATYNIASYDCEARTVTLTATPNSGSTIEWYDTESGGTPVAAGNSFTTPKIPGGGATYYVQAKNGTNVSSRVAVQIPADAFSVELYPTMPFYDVCGKATTTAVVCTVLNANTQTVDWYTTPSGGTAVQTGANNTAATYNYTVPANPTSNYYAQVRNFVSGCLSERVLVVDAIHPPVVSNSILGGTGSITLTATVECPASGAVVDWYDSPTGGTRLLAGSNTYTATAPFTVYAETRMTATDEVSIIRTAAGNEVNEFNYIGHIQSTTLVAGEYIFEAWGAQGGGNGGYGAYSMSYVTLSSPTTIKILVGEKGGYTNVGANAGGGGGGTFIVKDVANEPYCIAGGGGGQQTTNPIGIYSHGQATEFGSAEMHSVGGTQGRGGGGNVNSGASGGGGLYSDGGKGTYGYGGIAFINGGTKVDGSSHPVAFGGFGGGGSTHGNTGGGGGGGGYSGGGGGDHDNPGSGGGGGSFCIGEGCVKKSGIKSGNGRAMITKLP